MFCIRAVYVPRQGSRFDRDYYLRHHMPLAHQQIGDRIQPVRVEVEWDVRELVGTESIVSPCILSLYVARTEEVEAFRVFLLGDASKLLWEDRENYTDCEIEWRVSELADVQ